MFGALLFGPLLFCFLLLGALLLRLLLLQPLLFRPLLFGLLLGKFCLLGALLLKLELLYFLTVRRELLRLSLLLLQLLLLQLLAFEQLALLLRHLLLRKLLPDQLLVRALLIGCLPGLSGCLGKPLPFLFGGAALRLARLLRQLLGRRLRRRIGLGLDPAGPGLLFCQRRAGGGVAAILTVLRFFNVDGFLFRLLWPRHRHVEVVQRTVLRNDAAGLNQRFGRRHRRTDAARAARLVFPDDRHRLDRRGRRRRCDHRVEQAHAAHRAGRGRGQGLRRWRNGLGQRHGRGRINRNGKRRGDRTVHAGYPDAQRRRRSRQAEAGHAELQQKHHAMQQQRHQQSAKQAPVRMIGEGRGSLCLAKFHAAKSLRWAAGVAITAFSGVRKMPTNSKRKG